MKIVWSFLILSILFFSSCKNDVKKKKVKSVKKVETVKKKIVLTEENTIEFLTEYGKEHPETIIEISTYLGTMRVKLYTSTPLHRASFLYLINNDYYNDTYFHRVVKGFMIQGGNTDNWGTSKIRSKMGDYKIPAEINKHNFHKKGALSAARNYVDNPDKLSTPFEFFIVQGHTFDKQQLRMLEEQYKKKISSEQRKEYIRIGGTPHLDGEHTVFGEVIKGFDVIDKIASVPTDKGEWPEKNVVMQVKIIK